MTNESQPQQPDTEAAPPDASPVALPPEEPMFPMPDMDLQLREGDYAGEESE
jgi:hypothetical protein